MKHDPAVKGREPYCGTTACLAGQIVLAAGLPQRQFMHLDEVPPTLRPRFKGYYFPPSGMHVATVAVALVARFG